MFGMGLGTTIKYGVIGLVLATIMGLAVYNKYLLARNETLRTTVEHLESELKTAEILADANAEAEKFARADASNQRRLKENAEAFRAAILKGDTDAIDTIDTSTAAAVRLLWDICDDQTGVTQP